eukprot:CAMPEP_0113621664 /NCGR_PEP_ID=MMETSP0017_2-20120614/11081_1 /TAXON_ID=2856 /ORGANISM="Cylindrotheca closterium" /LENGTH=177 /DNA_ID=CAMNT_0000531435 /DNA_START=357 /DNA_END=890 /DNA_ORIENTATION=- /assembly_acc=CAM_ASM_000147
MKRYSPLTDDQIRLLDEIDFPWVVDPYEARWDAKYQELVDFYNKNGHLWVERPSALYSWIITQRRKRRGKGGTIPLTNEQIRLLDEIDFPWTPTEGRRQRESFERKWQSRYQELADFYKEHGHLKVKYQSSLYYWTVTQRRRRRGEGGRTPLTDEQIQLMDEIHFSWTPQNKGQREE